MDVRFNVEAAEKLIDSMDRYCLGINDAAVDSLRILNYSDRWCDSRKELFSKKINILYQELQQAINLESEYMDIYSEKVTDLRG